jgi:hypothetical protein
MPHATGIRRFLRNVAFATIAITALAASPFSFAGSPDGTYQFVKASGYASFGGQKYELTQDMLDQVGFIDQASFKIKRKRMKIDIESAKKLLDQLSQDYGVPIEVSVSGPSRIVLQKSGRTWVGKTSKPIAVKFSANYLDQEITGTLKSRISIKIRGKKMVMTTPITGSVLGYKIKAEALTTWRR